MKYYTKLRAVEVFEIVAIETVGHHLVAKFENDLNEIIDAETMKDGIPSVGDFLVMESDGTKSFITKECLEYRYASTEYLEAESVSLEDIQEKVIAESFGVEGNMVVCFLSLDNGFKTSGHSFCIHDDEFNEGLGRGVAFRNAAEKMWEIEGYHRMQVVHEIRQACLDYDEALEADD